MLRTLRTGMSYSLLTALLALSLMGPLGCSNTGGPTKCTNDTGCAAGQVCDTATGQCKASGTGCTADADCGTNKVCSNSKCYDDCTVDGFAGCDPGNTCDQTSRRCTCEAAACANVNNSGCNPSSNTCDNYCNPSNTGECSGNEQCVALTSDPAKGFCQVPKTCTADADCPTGTPTCDTTKGYCVPKTGCATDTDCTNNANGTKCNTNTGACVACLADADCNAANNETCNTSTNTCQGPTGCQNSQGCYATTPKTYCATKGAACQPAPSATCANMVSSEESMTSGFGSNNEAMVIWGIKEIERKSTNNCVSYYSGNPSCSDDADCPSGEVCFQGKCARVQSNGEVVIEFSYYAPKGIKTGYVKGEDGGTKNFASGTDRKAGDGWGDLATKLEIKAGSGDDKEGVARFSVCASQAFNAWFAFSDTAGAISNAACLSISSR